MTLSFVLLLIPGVSQSQEAGCDAACQAARKAANPLADTRAIITDNTVAFRTGTTDKDSYNFQLQPVYSMPLDGANLVWRGIIPIMGLQPGAVLPPSNPNPSPGASLDWGLGDTVIQGFYTPNPTGNVTYGYGLQVSLPTHSSSAFKGAGWGAGPAAVVFGQTGDLSWGGVLAHMWGEDGFSTTIAQPILTYGLGQGWYFGYNNVVSYNWNAANTQEAWTVPIGLTAGRTIIVNEESGTALDLSLGYYLIDRAPTGAANRQIKFGVSLFF